MASYASAPSAPVACCDGDKMIVPQGALLPTNICIKCGAPANGKPLKKNYYWHPQWIYVLVLIGVLIYAIVAMVVRKQQLLYLPLCEEHAARRKRMILIGWGLIAAGIAAIFLMPAVGDNAAGALVLLMFALLIAGIIVGIIGVKLIRPTFIDASYGSYSGVSRAFLDQLPRAVNATAMPTGMPPPMANFTPPGGTGTPPPPKVM